MARKIFYLHYIINFIDNEYKVCHSLDETYCRDSILGIHSDSFLKVQNDIYQFLYKNEHCFVRFSANYSHGKIKRESWMEHYLENDFKKTLDNKNNDKKSVIMDNNIGSYKQTTFFIHKIQLKMKRKVFDKIVVDPNYDKKEYNAQDLFFICYSYGFSFLDNQLFVLKNILNLIVQEKFNLNNIHKEFIKFISTEYQNSTYFKKFNEKLKQNNKMNIQAKIDQFIFDNYDAIYVDNFLYELFQWKTKLANLMILIRQTFCLHIHSCNNLVMKIYHDAERKPEFVISVLEIDTIMFLLSNDSIILLMSCSIDVKVVFTKILTIKQDINLNIDMGEFYIKLYEHEKVKLIKSATQLDDLFLFLSYKTKNPITIIINNKQMLIKFDKNTKKIAISKKNTIDLSDFDESLLVSKKILVHEIYLENGILQNIAQMIATDFIQQSRNKQQNIIIHHDEKRKQIGENNNILNLHILSDQSIKDNLVQVSNQYNSVQTIFLDGSKSIGSHFVGFECINQMYTDFGFIGGIYDDTFSLFELNTVFYADMQQNMSYFVSKMSNFFQKINNINLDINSNQYFDLFYIKPKEQEILVFYPKFVNLNEKKTEEGCIVEEKVECTDFFNTHLEAFSDFNQQNIKIHHNFSLPQEYNESQKKRSSKFFLPKINSNFFFNQFKIEKSNFYIVISRILEVKSIAKITSSIRKLLDDDGASLKIIHCVVKFLNIDFSNFGLIYFKNCQFKQKLHLGTSLNGYCEFNLMIIDSYFHMPILFDDFIEIQMHTNMNNFNCKKNYNYFQLIISHSKIRFNDNIPANCIQLSLDKCLILSVKNNILFQGNSLPQNDIDILGSSSCNHDLLSFQLMDKLVITMLKLSNCVLTPYLKIKGIFNWIIITNCVSPFIIDVYLHKLQIIDHKDEFFIKNMVSRAVSQQLKNSFIFNRIDLIIKNLEIECLENISIHKIQLINCSIKVFSNVKSKNIVFQNTTCSFQLIIADQTINYNIEFDDLIRYESEYMIMNSN